MRTQESGFTSGSHFGVLLIVETSDLARQKRTNQCLSEVIFLLKKIGQGGGVMYRSKERGGSREIVLYGRV
jgi:hypothetical protein